MIVSWDWLHDYVELGDAAEAAALVERLMMAGLNHESTAEVGGDLAIDLEITSNRPDCLGHLGIAREAAAALGLALQRPPVDFEESDVPIEECTSVTVDADAAKWCPQYRARVIHDVKIAPSPEWLQRRLKTIGVTPINNVVDVTNYVLMECGQPLHAFDYDKLDGRRIVVRDARPGEKFRAINNREYELAPSMGVIADAGRAVALAGVMGGAESEVSGSTRTILLESAEFDPLKIRRGSRALDLSSDSSYRFERRIDPEGVAWASDRACHWIARLAGGRVAKGSIHVGPPAAASEDRPGERAASRKPIRLRWARIGRILGIDIPKARAIEILERLGLSLYAKDDESGLFVPPSFRRDLVREIDLIEEVGRLFGYASVPEDKPLPLLVSPRGKSDRVLDIVRDVLCSCGAFEAVTFTFTDADHLRRVRPWSLAEPLVVRHSSRKQQNALRQSLLPSLLEALAFNEARGNEKPALFEIAHLFLPTPGSLLPSEPQCLGIVTSREIRELRGWVEALFVRSRISFGAVPAPCVGFFPDRCLEYSIGSERVGVLGEIDPAVCDALELRGPAFACELLLAPVIAAARLVPHVQPIPEHPAVERDFSVVLDERTRWSELEQVTRGAAGPLLESIQFLDLYRGKQVAPGKKSIAFRLVYRGPGRTLTKEEVDERQDAVRQAIEGKLGGKLRE